MKILWYSNAPWCGSGYGTQTALVVPKLIGLGHDVAVASFFGLQGTPLKWGEDQMTVFPGSSEDTFAQDLMLGHYQQHHADLLITLMDAWALDPNKMSDMTRNNVRLAHWLPVDTDPLSRLDHRQVSYNGSRVIAMTRHGEEMLKEFAPVYVPHAVDTELFKPYDSEDERQEVRAKGEFEDCFVIGMNAANTDPIRKGFGEQLQAFKLFHDEHPDTRMLIHTRKSTRQGVQMDEICKALELDKGEIVQFGDQYLTASGMTSTKEIAHWCGVLDLFSNCAWGEGFGLPILEAQACGVPCVVTDASAMREVCGAGWKVSGQRYWNAGHSAWWVTPNVEQIRLAYEKAYALWKSGSAVTSEGDRISLEDLKRKAREHALQYDIDRVVKEFWVPALEELGPEDES